MVAHLDELPWSRADVSRRGRRVVDDDQRVLFTVPTPCPEIAERLGIAALDLGDLDGMDAACVIVRPGGLDEIEQSIDTGSPFARIQVVVGPGEISEDLTRGQFRDRGLVSFDVFIGGDRLPTHEELLAYYEREGLTIYAPDGGVTGPDPASEASNGFVVLPGHAYVTLGDSEVGVSRSEERLSSARWTSETSDGILLQFDASGHVLPSELVGMLQAAIPTLAG